MIVTLTMRVKSLREVDPRIFEKRPPKSALKLSEIVKDAILFNLWCCEMLKTFDILHYIGC